PNIGDLSPAVSNELRIQNQSVMLHIATYESIPPCGRRIYERNPGDGYNYRTVASLPSAYAPQCRTVLSRKPGIHSGWHTLDALSSPHEWSGSRCGQSWTPRTH